MVLVCVGDLLGRARRIRWVLRDKTPAQKLNNGEKNE